MGKRPGRAAFDGVVADHRGQGLGCRADSGAGVWAGPRCQGTRGVGSSSGGSGRVAVGSGAGAGVSEGGAGNLRAGGFSGPWMADRAGVFRGVGAHVLLRDRSG